MLGIPWVMGFLGTLIFLFGLYRIFYNEYINTYFTKCSLFLDQNSKVISERWFIKVENYWGKGCMRSHSEGIRTESRMSFVKFTAGLDILQWWPFITCFQQRGNHSGPMRKEARTCTFWALMCPVLETSTAPEGFLGSVLVCRALGIVKDPGVSGKIPHLTSAGIPTGPTG